MIGNRVSQAVRRFTTTAARRGGHHDDNGGIPGANIPFKITNPYGLTAKVCLFFGSGFALPFVVVRHQLVKKN